MSTNDSQYLEFLDNYITLKEGNEYDRQWVYEDTNFDNATEYLDFLSDGYVDYDTIKDIEIPTYEYDKMGIYDGMFDPNTGKFYVSRTNYLLNQSKWDGLRDLNFREVEVVDDGSIAPNATALYRSTGIDVERPYNEQQIGDYFFVSQDVIDKQGMSVSMQRATSAGKKLVILPTDQVKAKGTQDVDTNILTTQNLQQVKDDFKNAGNTQPTVQTQQAKATNPHKLTEEDCSKMTTEEILSTPYENLPDSVKKNYGQMVESFKAGYGSQQAAKAASQKTGTMENTDVNFNRVARSADRAQDKNFVNVDEKHQSYWGDNGHQLTYEKRSDGTYLIKEDGVPMGFTDEAGMSKLRSSQAQSAVDQKMASFEAKKKITEFEQNYTPTGTAGDEAHYKQLEAMKKDYNDRYGNI